MGLMVLANRYWWTLLFHIDSQILFFFPLVKFSTFRNEFGEFYFIIMYNKK